MDNKKKSVCQIGWVMLWLNDNPMFYETLIEKKQEALQALHDDVLQFEK